MNQSHVALTLRAAQVAATALRSIDLLRPFLGSVGSESDAFEEALDGLRAVYGIRPANVVSPRLARLPRVPRPKALAKPARRQQEVEEEEPAQSAWDPEPVYEASRCKAFLMEIIRRAASDWVQYRNSRRMELRALAEQAYTWLFEEEPGHAAWRDRERALFKIEDEETGQPTIEVGTRRITSFLAICEACSLDPEVVRERARGMTIEQATRTGRRIERRVVRSEYEVGATESHGLVVDIDLDALDSEQGYSSYDNLYDSRSGFEDRAYY